MNVHTYKAEKGVRKRTPFFAFPIFSKKMTLCLSCPKIKKAAPEGAAFVFVDKIIIECWD